MQERIKEVADRIKELRDILEISSNDMSTYLRISQEKYLRYENGEEDIPASILYEISRKLGVEMSILLTGETPRMHYFSVTRNGQGVSVERRKQYKYQSLASNFINKKAEPFVVTVEPKPENARCRPTLIRGRSSTTSWKAALSSSSRITRSCSKRAIPYTSIHVANTPWWR